MDKLNDKQRPYKDTTDFQIPKIKSDKFSKVRANENESLRRKEKCNLSSSKQKAHDFPKAYEFQQILANVFFDLITTTQEQIDVVLEVQVKRIALFDIKNVEYRGLLVYPILSHLGFLLNKAKERQNNRAVDILNEITQTCCKKVKKGFKDFSEVRKVYQASFTNAANWQESQSHSNQPFQSSQIAENKQISQKRQHTLVQASSISIKHLNQEKVSEKKERSP